MDIENEDLFPELKRMPYVNPKERNTTSDAENQCSSILLNPTGGNAVNAIVNKNRTLNFTIKLCKTYRIYICKPLIPLKLVLFCWFGAGSFLTPFITVYFKQRGITLSELSTAYIIAPAAQFGGTLLSGIIADKIGRSKPVLVSNLVLTALMLICILLVPRPDLVDCHTQSLNTECQSQLLQAPITNLSCGFEELTINTSSCKAQCLRNITEHCQKYQGLDENLEPTLISLHAYNDSLAKEHLCLSRNTTYCLCNPSNVTYCTLSCFTPLNNTCFDERQKTTLNLITMTFYMMLMVVYSNCYRFLDVTAMYLVEEHKSDFGRERFFSITGNLVISPIAGYIVGATSSKEGEENYAAALYFFIALIICILLIVNKLEVRIKPPGKKMIKKSIHLLKNPDVLSFVLIVFVLGTAWSFTTKFLFWYLEELKVPSILIGLIPAAGALYGLPFLFTSNWWMKKIGTVKMFILALLGYVFYCVSYSFLINPWISLILESFNVVTYHLLWVAVVLRSHELAPEGLQATVISIAGSIHYHLGKSSGSLIGRFVMGNKEEGRKAFRVIAIICCVSAVFYALFLYCRHKYFQRRPDLEKGGSTAGQVSNSELQSVENIG